MVMFSLASAIVPVFLPSRVRTFLILNEQVRSNKDASERRSEDRIAARD